MGPDGAGVDLRVWGKSMHLPRPYPLLWHLVDTAAVTAVLWDRFLAVNQRRVIAAGLGASNDDARALAMFWAGLHDVGKATPGFQAYNPPALDVIRADPAFGAETGDASLRHEMATQLVLPDLLGRLGYSGAGRRSGRPQYRVAQLLGGHHGRFRESDTVGLSALGGGAWVTQRAALVDVLYEVTGRPAPPATVDPPAAVLLTGLVILADWLASQEHFLSEQLSRVPRTATRHAVVARLSSLVPEAQQLVDDAGLGRPQLRSATFSEMFPYPPNPLQRSVISELLPRLDGPGLLTVTAATGDGKTEVALMAARALAEASGASGFFFALPTMATADQMYRRVRRFAAGVAAGPAPVTLLHSMSWLNADYDARSAVGVSESVSVDSVDRDTLVVAPGWLRGRKRGLLAALSVGTVDQALIAALTTKHNALRLLGLSGKVFIVDEAHAYDEYMQRLLGGLLGWLGAAGCPVVLLSATLPSTQAAKLAGAYCHGAGNAAAAPRRIDYPGWTFVSAVPDREPVTISPGARAEVVAGRATRLELDVRPVHHRAGPEVDPLDRRIVLREVLAPMLDDGGCAAVICNTVRDAQRTYRLVRDWAGPQAEVVLLHSRFPARRREQLIELVTTRLGKGSSDRPQRMVVVATQVIEQSLDLDVDMLVSDLAPMAQLLQRAGRCHRHERTRPAWAQHPRLVVLDPQHEGQFRHPPHWGSVYDRYLLRATHLRLCGVPAIDVPIDVQSHMEAVYCPIAIDDPVLAAEHQSYLGGNMAERQVAELGVIPPVTDVLDLGRLSQNELDDSQATTRLGVESVRLVCSYLDVDGGRWLDAHRRQPLPEGSITPQQIRVVLSESIPVRASLLDGYEPPHKLPESWEHNAWLGDLQILWFALTPDGPTPAIVGNRHIRLDHDLGLVIDHPE